VGEYEKVKPIHEEKAERIKESIKKLPVKTKKKWRLF
jgi:hypothetical protein